MSRPWSLLQPYITPSLPDYCEPTSPFLLFLSSHLHTCLPTPLALISTTLGTLSITSWLFAQLPQIFKNYSLQSTSGLSIYFLVEWCLGDSANLFGALLTRQAAWQVVVAGYYVSVDIVLVWQYAWYTHLKPRRSKEKGWRWGTEWDNGSGSGSDVSADGSTDGVLDGVLPSGYDSGRPSIEVKAGDIDDKKFPRFDRFDSSSTQSAASSLPREKEREVPTPSSRSIRQVQRSSSPLPSPKTLLFLSMLCALAASAQPTPSHASPTSPRIEPPDHAETTGRILSWCSTLLYLLSRLPQLYKNHVRRSTSGLSAKLFIAAFFGNLFYSSSLLTNPCAWSDLPPYGGGGWVGPEGSARWEWVGRAAPFWLGAAGVLGLDAAVGMQFLIFGEGVKGGEPVVVVLVDEERRGRDRWRQVSGWMRGWVPSPKRLVQEERERLLAVDRGVYGTL
jgi:solute carrier family 66 (lysosomal lysine-arginine transporter), member 1